MLTLKQYSDHLILRWFDCCHIGQSKETLYLSKVFFLSVKSNSVLQFIASQYCFTIICAVICKPTHYILTIWFYADLIVAILGKAKRLPTCPKYLSLSVKSNYISLFIASQHCFTLCTVTTDHHHTYNIIIIIRTLRPSSYVRYHCHHTYHWHFTNKSVNL